MANTYGKVWILATEGVISTLPVRIRKFILFPNGGTDHATISYWGPESVTSTARASMYSKTCTVTDTYTITSTANDFEATEALANDIIEIHSSSTIYNVGSWQIGTRGGDDNVTVDIGAAGLGLGGGALNNDVAATYSWRTWVPSVFAILSATDANTPYQLDFGDRGILLPNLAMSTLEASAVVYVYYM